MYFNEGGPYKHPATEVYYSKVLYVYYMLKNSFLARDLNKVNKQTKYTFMTNKVIFFRKSFLTKLAFVWLLSSICILMST